MSAKERLKKQLQKMENVMRIYQTDKERPIIEVGLKALSDLSAQAETLRSALDFFKNEGMYHPGSGDKALQERAERLLEAAKKELP